MKSRLRILLTYVRLSLLYLVLGGIVLGLGGSPFASYLLAKGKMIITEGAPPVTEAFTTRIPKVIADTTGISELSEIQIPKQESRYGTISCQQPVMSAPIYYGDSKTALENGVGQYPNGNLPGMGKPILIGGHDGTYFAALAKVKIGDIIMIKTDYGQFRYSVASKKIFDQSDDSAYDLSQKKEQLILYTCYPFGQLVGSRNQRFFVYCEPVMSELSNGIGGNENEAG